MAPEVDSLNNVLVIAIGNFAAILTLIIKWYFSEKAADRKRREDMEDREKQRLQDLEDRERKRNEDLELQAYNLEVIKRETARLHALKEQNSQRRIDSVLSRIDENTAISQTAIKEANNINAKLEKLGLESTQKTEELISKVEETKHSVEKLAEGTGNGNGGT